MLRIIRESRGLTVKDMGLTLGVKSQTVQRWERLECPHSEIITRYLEHLELSNVENRRMKEMRRVGWQYDPEESPVANEYDRLLNGLGLGSRQISRTIGKRDAYIAERRARGVTPTVEDWDRLERHFKIAPGVVQRFNVAQERQERGEPMDHRFMMSNPEVSELYLEKGQERQDPFKITPRFMELLKELDDEGNISEVSELDPRLILLRHSTGVTGF